MKTRREEGKMAGKIRQIRRNQLVWLAALFVLVCISSSGVQAAEEYNKGGIITLSSKDAVKEFWIYTGYSGRFSYVDYEVVYSSSDDEILRVRENGQYEAKKEGKVSLVLKKKGETSAVSDGYTIHVIDYPKHLTISPIQKMQTTPSQDAKYPLATNFSIYGIPTGAKSNIKLAVTEGDMVPNITRRGNKVYLTAPRGGSCTVTLSYGGVDKTFRWTVKGIACEEPAFLVSPGQKKQIKVTNTGYRGFVWKSEDPKIAMVSPTGRVTARRPGNVVVTGTHKTGDYKVGCVVSVTPIGKVAAIETGKSIAKGTYSQPRRMQRGYYDCSSLVWLAYAPNGCNFGVSGGNAPVAASEAKYLEQRGKLIGEWRVSDMKKMRYQAGDLMFRTNANNGRHRGIYHVEMVAGYYLMNYDIKGKPVITTAWVNRTPEYTMTLSPYDIVCRP